MAPADAQQFATSDKIRQSVSSIGLLVHRQNRYLHLDGVLAIQLVILATGAAQDYVFVLLRWVFFPYSALGAA